jgi:OFA family oxalate/formate antiporter-like MFS transporter
MPKGYTPPAASAGSKKNYVPLEMLNTPLAGMMWITFIFGATSGLMAIGQWQPMMAEIIGGRRFAPAWLGTFGRFIEPVGILAIFNALGRIFWGRASDAIGRPRTMTIMFLLQGAAFMFLASVKSAPAIFLASAWVGLNFGGNFALFPAATADYFGTKNLGINYGIIFTAYGVAGILGPAVGGVLFDMTQSYLMAFIFAGVLCFIATASSLVIWGFDKERSASLSY